ncbi:hypothetical protein [Enterococcus casseliflavus]|uniref:hypothetical protein n=1 Tax=Enterococcus casseliflavus TaxID=37734 RepID=UPI00163C9F74|nr:hypothetical protein [Enterococcus casseliflavus]
MENEEVIARAIAMLNEILQKDKALKVSIEIDSEWEDGMKSLEVSVKYLPSEDVKKA